MERQDRLQGLYQGGLYQGALSCAKRADLYAKNMDKDRKDTIRTFYIGNNHRTIVNNC